MKKFLFVLLSWFALTAAHAEFAIELPVSVTNIITIDRVAVGRIFIQMDALTSGNSNAVAIVAPYTCYDKNGNVVRTGVSRITVQDIQDMLQENYETEVTRFLSLVQNIILAVNRPKVIADNNQNNNENTNTGNDGTNEGGNTGTGEVTDNPDNVDDNETGDGEGAD